MAVPEGNNAELVEIEDKAKGMKGWSYRATNVPDRHETRLILRLEQD